MSNQSERKDPFDGEYIGNIWGWKFSLFGGVVIFLLLALVVYRHQAMDVPVGFEDPTIEKANAVQDSTDFIDTIK
jgi:hypothetical protein